jgi:tetratricopeptide (TPR) repeat protein
LRRSAPLRQGPTLTGVSVRAILSAGFILLAFFSLPAVAVTSEPYVPADDAVILERVAQTRIGSDAFRRLQHAVAQNPNDLSIVLAYAKAAIQLGNEESDPRYFGYAQSALAPWWKASGPPVEVLQMRADILQWQHQFEAAKRDLDAIIAADSRGVNQAHLTRATVELVQGRPDVARHDCVTLIDHVETLIAATCIASVNSLTGDPVMVEKALGTAIAQTPGAGNEALLWAWTEMAEIDERVSRPDAAESAFLNALAVMRKSGHRDPYLLAAYADFLLDRGRPAEVLPLLDGLSRMDNLFLRLALAEDALGRGDDTMRALAHEHSDDLQRRFDETRQRGDSVHQREEAIYLLKLRHAPDRALEVAKDNWRRQRELIDARVLLEAAKAAGKPEAADEVKTWIGQFHVQDARL